MPQQINLEFVLENQPEVMEFNTVAWLQRHSLSQASFGERSDEMNSRSGAFGFRYDANTRMRVFC